MHLLGVGVADTHDTDVHFDGHVVRGEGDDARRDAQRECIARLVGSLDRRIVREARLRAAHGELRLVEEREPLVAAQRDVLAPDRGHRVVVPQRVVVVGLEVRVGAFVAQLQLGLVQFEQRARVDEAAAEGHVVGQGVGDHRTDAHRVALRVDAFDDEELVALVGVCRVGGRAAEDPLTLRDEEVAGIREPAFAAFLVDGLRVFGDRCAGGRRGGCRRGRTCACRVGRKARGGQLLRPQDGCRRRDAACGENSPEACSHKGLLSGMLQK